MVRVLSENEESGCNSSARMLRHKSADWVSTSPEILVVWEEYKNSPTTKLRDTIFSHYFGIVRIQAKRMHKKVPKFIEIDDLVSAGAVALVLAIETFQLGGAKFENYFWQICRWAMVAECRSMDLIRMPVGVRNKCSRVARAARELRKSLGREPTNAELAARMELSLAKVEAIIVEIAPPKVVSNGNDSRGNLTNTYADKVADKRPGMLESFFEQRRAVDFYFHSIQGIHRTVMELYYVELLPMPEVAKAIGRVETVTLKIRREAINTLRENGHEIVNRGRCRQRIVGDFEARRGPTPRLVRHGAGVRR
jgi:RNA polymerase sigma factor for flagellar operon FliA